jgi:hypothetical protein
VSTSSATYSYPYKPTLTTITGCGPPQNDSVTGILVEATNCPTLGNITLTMYGTNFIPPFVININAQDKCELPLNYDVLVQRNNFSLFTCTLPQATGTILPVSVFASGYTELFQNMISYALPDVQDIFGCTRSYEASRPGIVECNRKGGNVVTIVGSQFGKTRARALVNGKLCKPKSSSEVRTPNVML